MARATLLLVCAIATAGCGDAAPSTSTQALPTTAARLALLTVDRSGGAGSSPAALRIGPSDARLAEVAPLVPIPLPASSATDDPTCVACLVYQVTAVLSDGETASWHFPETRPPAPLGRLATWLATGMD